MRKKPHKKFSFTWRPIRMWRPSAARKALCLSPLVKARWADASSVERVPRMTALAEPLIFLAGRPAAQRAADVRRFGFAGLLLFLKLAIQHGGFFFDSQVARARLLSAYFPLYSEAITGCAASMTSSRRLQKYIAISTEITSSATPNSPATYLVLLLFTVRGSKNC
jgi:hypothetical protein